MIKLYYSPGACSLAAHIVLEALKVPYEAIQVDLKTHTVNGQDYYKINPTGAVPALIMQDGQLLAQNIAILMYLGELDYHHHLIPKADTVERIRCHEWLGLITADLHKAFGPIFAPNKFVDSENAVAEIKQHAEQNIAKVFNFIEKKLQPNQFALGKDFTIVDAYLFVMYRWARRLKVSLNDCPNVEALMQRVEHLSYVQQALKAEGLV